VFLDCDGFIAIAIAREFEYFKLQCSLIGRNEEVLAADSSSALSLLQLSGKKMSGSNVLWWIWIRRWWPMAMMAILMTSGHRGGRML
jgi:hypothetical protein